MVADDGTTVTALPVTVTVAKDRAAAVTQIAAGADSDTVWTAGSQQAFDAALAGAQGAVNGSAGEFSVALEALRRSVLALEPLNPRLSDGTVDFTKVTTSAQLAPHVLKSLVDGSNHSHWGDLRIPAVTFDAGAGYRLRLDRVGLQARNTFPNRSQGTNAYGSDDGLTWTRLTTSENTGNDASVEYLDVDPQLRQKGFRYVRLQVDHPECPPTRPIRASGRWPRSGSTANVSRRDEMKDVLTRNLAASSQDGRAQASRRTSAAGAVQVVHRDGQDDTLLGPAPESRIVAAQVLVRQGVDVFARGVGLDRDHLAPHRPGTQRLVRVGEPDGHPGIGLDVTSLLVCGNSVDDDVLAVGADPGLGDLGRTVRHQGGQEADRSGVENGAQVVGQHQGVLSGLSVL